MMVSISKLFYMTFLRCWQKQREDKRDAEDEATTTVGTFELVDGTQVLFCLSAFSLGS